MLRLGGPIVKGTQWLGSHLSDFDPDVFAQYHADKGYSCAYVPGVDVENTELVSALKDAFNRRNVMFAESACWDNMLDPDETVRKRNIANTVNAMRLADAVGARCCINVLGTFCSGGISGQQCAKNFSEDAFAAAVDIAREVIDSVGSKTAFFAYEIYPFNVVDCVEDIERLVKSVDRKMFGVHLDLVNLINCPRKYFSSAAVMEQVVGTLGDKIVSVHVKDITLRESSFSVMLEEVPLGEGVIDIGHMIAQLDSLGKELPLMMEHVDTEAQYDHAYAYIKNAAKKVGVPII